MAVEKRQPTIQGQVICRQHQWVRSKTAELLICAKCQKTANARPREQGAKPPPASPHHVGHSSGLHPEDQPYQSNDFADVQEIDDVGNPSYYEPPRTPNSVRRYIPTDQYTNQQGQQVIRQGNRQLVVHYGEPPPTYHKKRRFHPLFWIGMVMVLVIVATWVVNSIGAWWLNEQNQLIYGMPRTYQTDAVVFPGDTMHAPTHVIALNLNGRIEIIVLPHGKAEDAKIYTGSQIIAPNPSLVPVTVSFQDVDGSGRKAMLVHVGTQTIIYPNDGKQFDSPKQ